MGVLDLTVLLIFTAVVFFSGLSFSKSGKNMKSFFAAGGALPWWMSGLSLFMSFFSAGTFVVWGSIAYTSGWVAVAIQWTMCIAGLVIGVVIAPKWQKTRALTAAQFISERLGAKSQKIYTYLFLFISLFTTAAFLYPVAKIVEVSTGIPINASIIFLGVLILIYTAIGGLWAVIVTDVLQFVVLSAAVLIVVPLSFQKVGGVAAFIQKAPENFFSFVNEEYSLSFLIAFGLYNLFFIAGNWAYVQRYTSVATPKDAKKVGWLFSALYAISPIIWMLPPMLYRVMNPDLTGLADEGAYLLMCKEVLPVGILGLMLGGMVFATSSSVNTTLNISAGVIANDIYKKLFPSATDKKLVRVGKGATVALGILTIIIALLVPRLGGIVEVVMSIAALTGAAMFLPPIWALFSKKLNGFSTVAVTVISLAINGFFKFFAPNVIDVQLSRATEMMVGVGIPMLLLIVVEIIHWANKTEPIQFNTYRHLVSNRPAMETVSEGNAKGTRVIGIGVTLTGLLLLALAALATHGKVLVAAMGGIVVLLGGMIILKAKAK